MSGCDLMVWCTCAEKDCARYMARVSAWRRQLSYLDADFYAFCDGGLDGSVVRAPGVSFIELTPALGRTSIPVFPGWKRSLHAAMGTSMKYRWCVHVENDCFVKDWRKFAEIAQTDGAVMAGYNPRYGFIESSVMVLNDVNVRKRLQDQYRDGTSWNEDVVFEKSVSWLHSMAGRIGFSVRLERPQDRDAPEYGIICQCNPAVMDALCVKYDTGAASP